VQRAHGLGRRRLDRIGRRRARPPRAVHGDEHRGLTLGAQSLRAFAQRAGFDAELGEQRSFPSAALRAPTVPTTPRPLRASNGSAPSSATRALAPATIALASGCSLPALEARREPQQLVLVEARARRDRRASAAPP
jgi:hypothetical protein